MRARPRLVVAAVGGATLVAILASVVNVGLELAVLSWTVPLGIIGVTLTTIWGLARSAGHDNSLLRVLLFAGVCGATSAIAGSLMYVVGDFPPGVTFQDVPPARMSRPAAVLAEFGVAWVAGALLPVTFGLLLFPDGRLVSPRWRWVGVATVAALALLAAEELVISWPTATVAYNDSAGTGMGQVGWTLLAGCAPASLASLVVRYRRADGVVRHQIRWLIMGAVPLIAVLLLSPAGLEQLLVTVGLVLFFSAYGVAVLRYRLFDIDVVINRTLVFGTLAAFITGIYAAIVVGLGTLLGDRSNPVLAIAATALVAAVFEPFRAHVQRWANVVAYGRRATPYEVLAGFADQLRQPALDPEQQTVELARLLADGTGARRAVVWLEDGMRLRPVATAPPGAEPPPPASSVGELAVDAALPVTLDGELLGALSIDARRGAEVTALDRRVLGELTGQAVLVLGNARLQARLRQRLHELTESRRRLVQTTDEARRRLERDLHDGAQQQLVAVRVKLGLARTLAGREDADELIPALDRIAGEADAVVDSLRNLARGIYPPLLEAEGLAVALEAQARKVPLPVSVEVDGVGRHPREVEACVYFCVVEALGNVAAHAAATHARVSLRDLDGVLTFAVTDDGAGFDPAAADPGSGLPGMADRIDTVGGRLEVDTEPGQGTTVRGSIPVPAAA